MTSTIHYNGVLENRARLEELLDAARLYCADNRWMYLDVDERILGQVESAHGEGDWNTVVSRVDDTLQGVIITPHPKSDPLRLTFNSSGELVYYMPLSETEYWEIRPLFINARAAGIETHIAVCEFLHFLQDNFMPGLNVYDETNYFETSDFIRAESAIAADENVQAWDTEPEPRDPYAPEPAESDIAFASAADTGIQTGASRSRSRSSAGGRQDRQEKFPPGRKSSQSK
jgi:hypothetical protein